MGGFAGLPGFKLSLDWREQQGLGVLPPFEGDLYAFLREAGFAYLEFGMGACVDERELALLRREAALCREGGLGVALHPYLSGAHNPASFGERPEALSAVESVLGAGSAVAAICGVRVPVVLHPAACSYEGDEQHAAAFRGELLRRSRLFFAEMERRARTAHASVEPVAEHQVPPAPGERVMRIGDTYRELLEVVGVGGLGICWDTGHYLLSVERHGQSERPSDDFLRLVRRVHLHDVVDGQDHRVVSAGSHRLRDYMRLLQERGFSGGTTLEYSAWAIRSAGGLKRAVEKSVAAIAAWAI